MIYEMHKDVQTILHELGIPIHVKYAPERTERNHFDPVILIMRDPEASDRFRAPQGQNVNARRMGVRDLACKAVVFARSTLPGAGHGDHERECERLVDALWGALYKWAAEGRTGGLDPAKMQGRYVPKKDRNDLETWPGVAYEMVFAIARGSFTVSYTPQTEAHPRTAGKRPEGAAARVKNTTRVSLALANPDDFPPETGCGGD